MGDRWDFHLRKLDIAWEITKQRLPASKAELSGKSNEDFQAIVKEALEASWRMVSDAFPPPSRG